MAALNTFPGDFDGTDGVAFADFLTLAGNFGKVGLPYSEGNIDLVDDVSFRDFQTLADNFGKGGGASAAAVPEPSSLTLICLAGFLTEFVRKRRLATCW